MVIISMFVCLNCFNLTPYLGAYGFVFVAQDLTSGKEYALKVNIAKKNCNFHIIVMDC